MYDKIHYKKKKKELEMTEVTEQAQAHLKSLQDSPQASSPGVSGRIQWNAVQKSSSLADVCRAAVPVAISALGMSGLSQHYLSFSFKNI